ncbi:MAG: hypothetical protein OXR66_00715 [Candidatus Woesearchaeota archaeon]|nr:hypothetical protein [Candidatus Woesearchaeota archaeon]
MANSVLGNSTSNMTGSVSFTCPSCKKEEIIRTRNEREIVANYSCKCGFTGPN